MQKQVLNYRIIIEPEKMGRKTAYNAYCPTLGLADYGYSVDETIKNIKSLIKFHIECLIEDNQEVPTENTEEEIITSTRVLIDGLESSPHVIVG
ncbi:type II toxin-antitoxin system HicB family antitoxin [Candidatus Microgenomates bacterium]|nr:type II toxin-antitoxin system HicB family antitoxin [Candidatus Microgenomates bacterium]